MTDFRLSKDGQWAQNISSDQNEWVSTVSDATYLAWVAEGNEPNPYVAPPPPVPSSVPMWAVRTVLQNDGLFDQAQALVTTSTDNALKNVWEYGNFASRNSTAINSLALALGLSSEQVDDLFKSANQLEV